MLDKLKNELNQFLKEFNLVGDSDITLLDRTSNPHYSIFLSFYDITIDIKKIGAEFNSIAKFAKRNPDFIKRQGDVVSLGIFYVAKREFKKFYYCLYGLLEEISKYKMKKLAFFIGIPGSGKSTYAKQLESQGYTVICPDQIRKELFKNINEQRNSATVFATAKNRIIKSNTDVVFDATNCKWERNLQFLKNVEAQITFYVFMDSTNKEKCFLRIQDDLKNKIDRSNVPEHEVDNMHANFMETLEIIKSEPTKSKYNFVYV